MELQDFGSQVLSDDDTLGNATLPKFFEKMALAVATFGMKSFYIANELGPFMEAAGFVNVSLKTIKVPVGTWPKVWTPLACPSAVADGPARPLIAIDGLVSHLRAVDAPAPHPEADTQALHPRALGTLRLSTHGC